MTVDKTKKLKKTAPAFIGEAMSVLSGFHSSPKQAGMRSHIAWNNGPEVSQRAPWRHADNSAGADTAAARDKGSIIKDPRPSVSDFENSSYHLSSFFLEIIDAHEEPHGLQAYHPARMTAMQTSTQRVPCSHGRVVRNISRSISTRIDPAGARMCIHLHLIRPDDLIPILTLSNPWLPSRGVRWT